MTDAATVAEHVQQPDEAKLFTQNRWVGAPRQRVEDPPLLTGSAKFVADLLVDRAVDAAFVRSPHAHAELGVVATDDARESEGVVAVFTAKDLNAAPITDKLPFADAVKTPRYPLARDKVRFAGEAVAMVLAEDRYMAEDAAELVLVDYEPLPVVVETEDALAGHGEPLFDAAPENVYYRSKRTSDGLEEAFLSAAYVHRTRVHTNRYLAAPMEGRGIVADYDRATGQLTCWMSTQAPHVARMALAQALGLTASQVRVIAPAVGGAFGMKNPLYPEDLAVAEAAVKLGRPVRWIEDRAEHLTSAAQGKEQLVDVELAFDDEAMLVAARGRFVGDSGAYSFSQVGGLIECMVAATAFPGPYTIREYGHEVIGVLTNKPPIAAYRGVGFTAAQTAREVAMDEAARALDVDPVDLRRRNLIPADAYPYTSASGMIYDSGSNHECLEQALALVDVAGFREEQAAARAEGQYLGIGVSPFVEMTSYGPKGGLQAGVPMRSHDNATALMEADGTVRIAVGTFAHGQGHATTFAQLAADVLGVEPDVIHILEGDTAVTPFGMGTFGSRSAVFGGGAVTRATVTLRDRILDVAGCVLEVDSQDLELRDGRVEVIGDAESGMALADVAAAAYFDQEVRAQLDQPRLEANAFYDAPTTFPNGCVVVVADVDPASGAVKLVRAAAVDDCGRIINPTIVEGQLRGGFAQGVGGALLENLSFSEEGQPLATTYLDYLLPRATEVPRLAVGHVETPSPWSVGGVKGMAEGGAIGTPAAVINAVLDALAPFGVSLEDLPLTPATVWELVHQGGMDALPEEARSGQ